MSFKKRNTVLSAATSRPSQPALAAPGLRPSPLDGRPTTSTGTSSLDQLLAGHAGLPLGTCLLVEEHGTTDFSGVLLRYYAAEGLVQGHTVHTVAFPPAWRYDLPGLAAASPPAPPSQPTVTSTPAAQQEKMKIAWRYEALGNNSNSNNNSAASSPARPDGFCHSFDLAKRLAPASCKGTLFPVPFPGPYSLDSYRDSAGAPSALKTVIHHLTSKLEASGPGVVHRLVVPSLLNPSLYPPACCQPAEVLQFLHGLRGLLRQYSAQLTVLVTLPVSLFLRTGGLTRWMELLCDGVIELIPHPPQSPATAGAARMSGSAKDESQQSQGFMRVHSLPVYHERGGGGGGGATLAGENLSFNLSASRGLVIKPHSLPPMVEDDHNDSSRPASSTTKDGIDF